MRVELVRRMKVVTAAAAMLAGTAMMPAGCTLNVDGESVSSLLSLLGGAGGPDGGHLFGPGGGFEGLDEFGSGLGEFEGSDEFDEFDDFEDNA